MQYRRHLPIGALSSAFALAVTASAALAQGGPLPPPPGPPPDGRQALCVRLEGQLAALDRGAGGVDGRAEQIRRYEEAANRQQADLDRAVAQSRRLGCDGGGFFLFRSAQHPQCDPLNAQIRQMRTSLDQMLASLNRLQGGGGAQDEQRRAILIALGQNGCGPQYRVAEPTRARGLFDSLFGSPDATEGNLPEGTAAPSGAFRTVCVRTCDGYYFPISYSTTPARFGEDEKTCQRMCPAAEVALFAHRTSGEDMKSAVSTSGKPYAELPNAFRYRQELNAACSCRRAGESWAAALGGTPDDTVQRGDIVVTDEKAKALSQPQPKAEPPPPRQQPRQDSTRSRTNPPPAGAKPATPPATAAAPLPPPGTTEPAGTAPPSAANERPRSVGPQFYR
jgi:Protein of unknown function (DUF2865)